MTDATRELTLMDLLDSRENRVNHQKELLEQFAGHTLVSMTLNIPGPVKDRPEYRRALKAGLHRLKPMLDSETILYEEFRPLLTGPEGYVIVTGDPIAIKKAAIAAEEADALGRLFDIDVLVIDDAGIRSISRSQLGAEPRKCLLCGENAKACARSRAHSMDDLLKKINEILSEAHL